MPPLFGADGARTAAVGSGPGHEPRRATLRRYAIAAASIIVATIVRRALDPLLGANFPFATLFLAVLLSAWLGGFGPALLAGVLGGVAGSLFLLEPRQLLELGSVESIGGQVLYAAVSLGIALIGGGMRAARRRAEANAADIGTQREQLRVTLESIGDAVIATDTHGRVTAMNSVAAALTGWRASDAHGRPLDQVFRVVDEHTGEPVRNAVDSVLAEGRIVDLANHTVLIARDGTARPIEDSAAPIRDRAGTVSGVVLAFRDVTERRRLDQQLRASEQELSDFFENANVGLHFVGPDGIILRANQTELDLLGYRHDEYVGHHIAEFHVDRATIDDILRRLLAGEIIGDYPARLRCRDGSIREVSISSSARWENGRFVHSRGVTRDLTSRRRAEEAQALLAAVVESSDDAIITKTLDGVITSWNLGAERLFGYAAAEAIGQPITLIIPPERQAEEPAIQKRLRAGERIDHFETVRASKDGRRLDISLTISPIRDPTGRIIGVSKVARDVTARKQAEEALRESEERFRTLADNIAQLAWMANGAGWIFWYNRRWFDYTGTTLEAMEGWGWRAVHHPDHVDRVVEKISRCFRSGEVWEDTFPLRGRDGTYRWFLSRAIPIRDPAGRVVRWFGTNTDVTAQREAEEALRAADRRKDVFLATLAHELRNPLAPVRNSLEIMKRAHGDARLLEEAQATIERQVTHFERLVDDLVDMARINRDRLELRRQPVELTSIVQHAVETCRPLAEASQLRVSVSIAPEPIRLDADPVRLAQVFSNLLNNACKYTAAGGDISVETRREGQNAVVSVRDSGIGIPPQQLPAVFDMFVQLEHAPERLQSGLGIGLTLVRRLVELHGGTVEAHSEGLGRGSEFVVRVPLLASAARPMPPPAPPPAAAVRHRVLVVDDNTDAAESLATLLQINGHETRLAHDGTAALAEAAAFRPDVVLLDIGLPKLSGHEVARQIRAQPWGGEILLVALTGWGQDEDRRKSREIGFDHHLVKPVDLAELTQLLVSLPSRGVSDPASVS